MRIPALAPTPPDRPKNRARGLLWRGRGGGAPPLWRGRRGRGGGETLAEDTPARGELWGGRDETAEGAPPDGPPRQGRHETPADGAPRGGWRSPGRLGGLAGVFAAVGLALLFLSESDEAPLVIRVAEPAGIAVADGQVWIASPGAGTVTRIDAAGRVHAPLRVGGAPARIAAGANGLWVTDAAAGRVVPVAVPEAAPPSAATRPPTEPRVFPPLTAGPDASDVALAAGAVWVASSADRRVYALEPGGRSKAIAAGEGPVALAADARRVVAADARGGSLAIIDARTRSYSGQVRVGGTPVDVALAGDAAWVADIAGARLVRVDLGSLRVTHTLAIGRLPIALASAGDDLYALVAGDRSLVKVTRGVVQWRRSLPGRPTALAVDARHVWVGAGRLLRFER